MNRLSQFLLLFLLLCWAFSCTNEPSAQQAGAGEDWPIYHGDATAAHYSNLEQITKENVKNLQVAWTYQTGDGEERSQIQCNPIKIGNTLYLTSPRLKVLALNAATGDLLWSFDPLKHHPASGVNRGVVYWEKGEDQRILFTAGTYLYVLDAASGRLIDTFGENGMLDLRIGLDQDIGELEVIATTPGIIYQDLLILGSRVSEGEASAPGHIRAFDVKTGERAWIFHTIPHPGEFGYDTWPEGAWKEVGGANSWAGFSLDEQRGMVFASTGSPAFDFHGGNRHGDNLFGNSIIALNAKSGERIWHYQTIHHDLWDRDLPCQPNLLRVKHDGKWIDAVAQVTKHGFVFVLDREKGTPLFPVEEKPVPASDLKNELASETQPIPTKPAPFVRQSFQAEMVTDLNPAAQQIIQEKVAGARMGNMFVPPSEEGMIVFPGFDGGADWGGAAVDPQKGILYINGSEQPWYQKMIPIDEKGNALMSPGKMIYSKNCALCHGANLEGQQHVGPELQSIAKKYDKTASLALIESGKGRMPGFKYLKETEKKALVDFLYGEEAFDFVDWANKVAEDGQTKAIPYSFNGYVRLLDQDGYPGIKPPWGTLNAINLNTGEYEWTIPLGEYPELSAQGIPPTGANSYGGPVATAGGLIFIAATPDEKIRAFDQDSGALLWQADLPAAGYATPSIYSVNGKQYVVIAAGGGKLGTKSGDSIIAFALPE